MFDTYLTNSIKNATRDGRGNASQILFDKDDNVPENLLEFLLNTKNKVALFELLREEAANPLIWHYAMGWRRCHFILITSRYGPKATVSKILCHG